MKRIPASWTTSLAFALINCFALAEIQKGQICYLEDLTVPFTQIIKNHDCVIVDLFAQWCGPCKNLNPVLATIAKEYPDIIVLKVDIEQFDDIRTEYGVKSIPTIIFFKHGTPVAQEVGYLAQPALESLIQRYLRT